MSSYLFLICAEGLSSLFQQVERNELIKGVVASRGGRSINHLLFADDCAIFCKAKQEEWCFVEHILLLYEKVHWVRP